MSKQNKTHRSLLGAKASRRLSNAIIYLLVVAMTLI
jgi:hypothetical protein